MISIEDNGLFDVFPAIKTMSEAFEYQNSMLNKIVLTGKINALEIAENLFNFTEKTAQTFTELQSQIVLNLLEENKNELLNKATAQAKITINSLIKSLSLRKKDIQVLAKDSQIKDFLQNNYSKNVIIEKLKTFQELYNTYNEIVILDNKGSVRANINELNNIRFSKDDILNKIKKTDGVVCEFRATDMFIKQRTSYFCGIKILNEHNEQIGTLVTFFDFNKELKTICDNLITNDEIITIVDNKNNVLFSSEKGIDRNFVKGVKVNEFVVSNSRFHVKVPSDIVYENLELFAVVSYKSAKDINIVEEFSKDELSTNKLAQVNLNNDELQKLATAGYSILEDLSDVIINGELIAAKSKQYILIPILDNLREVSFRIVKLIEISISNLQDIIDESLSNDVELISKFIIDAIIRDIYEKCNDVRWWTLMLSHTDLDLGSLNELYDSYSSIFVYDEHSKIINSSNSFIGDMLTHNYTNGNKDTKCFMSKFEKSKFYNEERTFIYFSGIAKDSRNIGGLGAVLDVKSEFKSIFDRALGEKEAFAVLVDKDKNVLYSTQEELDILDKIELVSGFKKDIEVNNKLYKVAVASSNGYNGYINSDLFVIVAMEK